MAIQKVAVIGANGHLGPSVLSALVSANTFDVTVISRKNSKSTYPPSVPVEYVSDDPSIDELIPILTGQDALVVTFGGSNAALQILLADAAVKAGVKRFIPADFGSCDSSSKRALDLVPLYKKKQKVRQHLQGIVSKGGGDFSWTSLVCGHFFDYGLTSGLLQFDVGKRKVRILDGGDIRWSTTTLTTVGKATVRILQKDEETRNRMLYVQSFCVTQNEVLKVLKRVAGEGKDWEEEQVSSEAFIKEIQDRIDKSPNGKNGDALEELVSVVGIIDANWEGKDDFANDLLGVGGENVDEVVRKAIGE